MLECALNFTVHLLKVGPGAVMVGNESHFYRSVQFSPDQPDCFPIAPFDSVALDRRAVTSRNKNRIAEPIRVCPDTGVT